MIASQPSFSVTHTFFSLVLTFMKKWFQHKLQHKCSSPPPRHRSMPLKETEFSFQCEKKNDKKGSGKE